jgi:outer membrane protein assembly factor BamB
MFRGNAQHTAGTYSSPAIGVDGTVCIDSANFMYAPNGATGALVWRVPIPGEVQSSPAVDARGTVYVGANDGKLYALNGTSGVLKWSFDTGAKVESSPTLGADGTLYVGSGTTVFALS